MATISSATQEKVISVKAFLGLNENPDGDNKLKLGEATVCRNFKVTDNGNLKKRAGTVLKYTLGDDKPIMGMWHGLCTKHELFLAACDGHLWMLQDDVMAKYATDLGAIDTTNDVFMFGFDEKVFIMNGVNYYKVYYQENEIPASASITATPGSQESTLTDPVVDVDVFKTKVDAGGVYTFALGDNGWFNGFDITSLVDLDEYGISYDGTAIVGDKLTVGYTAESLGAWYLANLTDPTSPSYEEAYRPLVRIGVPPAGGGEDLQQVNKLNGCRRLWISPDGVDNKFYLPEKQIITVDYVKNLKTQEYLIPLTDYTYDVGDADTFASVTFISVPALSSDSYEIGWTVPNNFASTVAAMRYAELYAGTQDNRVFVYGDGSNHTFYSDFNYPEGKPCGDYFPDLNEIAVGDTNTPITALIRHYGKMLAFKPEQTYSIDYGIVTLADGLMTPAFYSTPINKILGNEPLGQVMLVQNAPLSICQGNLYEWRNGSSYSANISVDERQAKRISDRISSTLRGMKVSDIHCYDDNLNSEYYIIDGDGNALVYNYRADAWYYYTGLKARIVTAIDGVLYIGTKDGKILQMDWDKFSDMGKPIDCYWESGSLDFGAAYMRKYSALMWVGLKAEEHNKVTVTAKTERSIENTEVEVEPDYENYMPRVTRCKVKVKKFVYYKLCFLTNEANSTVTIVDTEIKVRYTAQAK